MSIGRRSLQVVAFICTLVVGTASMAAIVTQTAWFKEWLRGFIVRQAEEYVNGRLSIGRLGGNLFFGIELEEVAVTVNGKTVVDVADVGLDYNFLTFLRGDIVLDDIRLNRPVLRIKRTAEGWNLTELVKVRTPDPDEPKTARTIEIGEIGVSDGTLYFETPPVAAAGVEFPSKIERLDASISVASNEDALTVDVGHVSLRAVDPDLTLQSLSGVVRRTRDEVSLSNLAVRTRESSLRVDGTLGNIESESPVVDATLSSDRLTVGEFAAIVPALKQYAGLQPALEVTANGPADRLAVDVNVRERTIGKATADLTIDAVEPTRRVAGTVSVEHLNIAPLVPPGGDRPLESDITGAARVDLALPDDRRPLSGTYAVNAADIRVAGYQVRNLEAKGRIDGEVVRVDANATAYGGRAAVNGIVRTGDPLAVDMRGTVREVDLRNLPASVKAPPVASTLGLDFSVTGRGDVFSGQVTMHESSVAGMTIAPGTAATFRVGMGAPQYTVRGSVSNLDLQQIGRDFEVTALADDRYRSRIDATFDVAGSGGGEFPLAVDGTGTITSSEVFGAQVPHLDFTANVAGGDARVRAKGQFEGLDPGGVSGNARIAGVANGAFDVDATVRDYEGGVTVESVDAAGRVSLNDSTVGQIAIDEALVDGRYAGREGDITELTVTGPDLNVRADGHVALSEEGASNLQIHLDTASLERIGELVGQPLKGSAVVEATITGNARVLEAAGTLKGSDIGYGDNEALSLASDFNAMIPNLTPADASVQSRNTLTFLEVGGQRITELDAQVTYSAKTVEFDARAQEGLRELTAAGQVILHPDHQEIHLPTLALRSEDVVWSTPAGSAAAITYGNDRITVDDLQLVSGDQRITASGVVGSEREALTVRVENVDVAQVDRLLLGDQRIAGRFSADATVRGELKDPAVEANFALTGGSFRDFAFESFRGDVDYGRDGVTLDVRLQQNATHWLEAKGTAPLTLFRPTPEEFAGMHHEPAPGEEVDIAVTTSQIDLGVVQGFTAAVANVTGTMQANLRVTGSGYDPHVNGAVDIRGGAFEVPELGTKYTGLETRVDINDQGVAIQEFKILDERGFPLTVGGTLAFHARSVGAVDVTIAADKFEVIDNELADVKLNTDIRLTGEVRAPRVEGTIDVENATIEVARLLEVVGSDAYATEATQLPGQEPVPAEGAAGEPAEEPSIFDALRMDVTLSIPSNMVLRGDDIRASNAPVSLGDMNITVGGNLDVQKEAGSPIRLVGDVNTVRGSYTFQGRQFEILRDGRIGFSGNATTELDPLLDLEARRIIAGVETFIRVRGTMRNPELAFRSNPPLEEADILSLIIFNQPVSALGEGQQVSLAERAGALAGGYLTSGLSRSIGNALELDEFEIQAQGEGGAGPSLIVGEQVGRRLFFRVRQGFGAGQVTELMLEYQIADYLRLQGSIAEGSVQRVQFRRVERGGLDLVFFFSY